MLHGDKVFAAEEKKLPVLETKWYLSNWDEMIFE